MLVTRFSGNAIFYEQPGAFKHKFIVAGERALVPGEQEMQVKQILRELLSEGRVSKRVVVEARR